MQPVPPCPAPATLWQIQASALLLPWDLPLGRWSVGFDYLFIFPPGYVALWGSKAHHKLARESVSWSLETSLFFKTPFLGRISVPTSFVFLFIFFIFFYLLSKTMGCLSGCLMSSASIQKFFYGIFSAFKCSLVNLWGRNGLPSYSSTILGPPARHILFQNVCIKRGCYLLVG